jgi:hypothetical protein
VPFHPSPPPSPPPPSPPPPSPPLLAHSGVAAVYAGCTVHYDAAPLDLVQGERAREASAVTEPDGAFTVTRSASGGEEAAVLVLTPGPG